jgi:hypothetical protein
MANLARQGHGIEQFLAWVASRERKHELVNGEPSMMAGAGRGMDEPAPGWT